MDYIVHEVLSEEIVPVLLGYSPEMNETARRMFRKYGVISHVFCEKVPLPLRFSLCMKFHQIRHTVDERLMMDALFDFANQLENADVILYLIPCTEGYANMVWHGRDELERRFVIADRAEMTRVWLGEDNTLPKGGDV